MFEFVVAMPVRFQKGDYINSLWHDFSSFEKTNEVYKLLVTFISLNFIVLKYRCGDFKFRSITPERHNVHFST